MTLFAQNLQTPRERTAPPDLDHIPQRVGIGRLTQNTMIPTLALPMRPFKQFHRPVDRRAFLIAGDQKRNRSFERVFMIFKKPQSSCDRGGHTALHISCAAPV